MASGEGEKTTDDRQQTLNSKYRAAKVPDFLRCTQRVEIAIPLGAAPPVLVCILV